ncbi:hypothetical protein M405DRAFT_929899 [Rhizopogon salebrosus TDB-379]|nr:hypothetical protein M405DRAFT_929899 [Rhizopogon salebrosus TDB-379]
MDSLRSAHHGIAGTNITSALLGTLVNQHLLVFLYRSFSWNFTVSTYYFNNSQRQATKDAATITGIHILCITNLNEPTRCRYHLQSRQEGERRAHNTLISNLGGGALHSRLTELCGDLFRNTFELVERFPKGTVHELAALLVFPVS